MSIIIDFYYRYKIIINNLIFVGLVQVFGLLAPLITYPYLVDVLGMELYGAVISAQVLVSYATLVIEFGSNSICAKNISIYRDNKSKLSEIISSVLTTRFILWIGCFFIYTSIVLFVPAYREYLVLFLLSYLMTTNELLFPQFYFQGIEKMKTVSLLNILVKAVFILFVFLFVKQKSDYLIVPAMYALGFALAGIIALYIIFKKHKIKFHLFSVKTQLKYFRECSPILATDLVCTIKDKFNYMLVGMYMGMSNVVVYDLGFKLMGLASKPSTIITTVLLPRFAQNRNVRKLQHVLIFVFLMSVSMVVVMNVFLEPIVAFFLRQEVDLLPIRLFSIVPIFLSPSVIIANNFFIGFGYNRFMFYSIVITTLIYLGLLVIVWVTGYLYSLYSFIFLAIISYFVEFVYRLYIFQIKKKELL